MSVDSFAPSLRRLLRDAEWVAVPIVSTEDAAIPRSTAAPSRPSLGLATQPSLDSSIVGSRLAVLDAPRTSTCVGETDPHLESSATAFIKVSCHLEHGVAVMVSNGLFASWVGYLSVSGLSQTLKESFPSIELPIVDVMRLLEKCPMDAVGGVTVVTPNDDTIALFMDSDDTVYDTCVMDHSNAPIMRVRLSSSIEVLKGYSIALTLHIACHMPHTAAVASDAVTSSSRKRVRSKSRGAQDVKEHRLDNTDTTAETPRSSASLFKEMIYEPRQAQLVTLAEAVLLLCDQTKRTPDSVAEQMTTLYQERFAAATASHDGNVQTSSHRMHQATAEALLRDIQLPAALHAFLPFANNLLRFAKGEPNQLVGGGGRTPLPEKSGGAAVTTASTTTTPARSIPPVPTTTAPSAMVVTPPARSDALVTEGSPAPPLGQAPAAQAEKTAADDAQKRLKKVRKLFS